MKPTKPCISFLYPYSLRGGEEHSIAANLEKRRQSKNARWLALPAARDWQLARWECTAGFAAPPWPRRAAYRGDVGWVPSSENSRRRTGRLVIFDRREFFQHSCAPSGPCGRLRASFTA